MRSQLNARTLGHTKESTPRRGPLSASVYAVALVVDPEYGPRIETIAATMPVWVVDTPTNRRAAESLRQRAPSDLPHTAPGAVTIFRVQLDESPAAWALAILVDIDLHHGKYSHTPPCTALEVIGTGPTNDLRDALREYGLTDLESRADGFRASAPRVA